MIKTFDEFLSLYCHLNGEIPSKNLEEMLLAQLSQVQKAITNIGEIESYYMIIIEKDVNRILQNCIRDNEPININTCANILNWLKRYKDQNVIENIEINLKDKESEAVKIIVSVKFKNYKEILKMTNVLRGIVKA